MSALSTPSHGMSGRAATVRLTVVVLFATVIGWGATVGWGSPLEWFDEQRVSMLLVVAVALMLLVPGRTPLRSADRPVMAAILLAVGVGLASAVAAPRADAALIEWASVAAIWLVAVRFCVCPEEVPRIATVLALVPATAYVTGVAANYASALALGLPVGADTLLVGFANPRFPAQLQALTLPLFPIAWQLSRRPAARAALSIVWLLWWACVVGSGSRTAWLALALAAVVAVLMGPGGRRWCLLQLPHFVVGALAYWIAFFVLPSFLDVSSAVETGRFSSTASIAARFELWRLAAELVAADPLLGTGPMHFAYHFNDLGAHPHNWWLQIASEWGVVAALAFLFVVLLTWRRLVRNALLDQERSCLSVEKVAVIASFTVWTIGILLDGYMVVPTSQLISTLVLGLALAQARAEVPSRVEHNRPMPALQGLMASSSAVAVCTLATLPWTSLSDPTQREQAWRAANPVAVLWPRFWAQGWIGPDKDPCFGTVERSPNCASIGGVGAKSIE